MDRSQETLRQRPTTGSLSANSPNAHAPQTPLPETKQARVLRELRAESRRERRQMGALASHYESSLADLLLTYLKTILLVVVVGLLALLYFAPELLWKFLSRRAPLPSRRIMTIYPRSIHLDQSLPRFFQNYAIAKSSNRDARQAVRHVAALRRFATNPSRLQQKLTLTAWEHDDFNTQLPATNADGMCGEGFRDRYDASPWYAQDALLTWCLLYSGHHDAYVSWNMTAEASLTRGIQGTIVQYVGQSRMHPGLVYLPLQDRKAAKVAAKTGDSGVQVTPLPSTRLPPKMLHWLSNLPSDLSMDEVDFFERYSSALYRYVTEENGDDRWVVLRAVCTIGERERHDTDYRRVATECTDTDNAFCCSVYDPSLPAFVRHVTADDDDTEESRKHVENGDQVREIREEGHNQDTDNESNHSLRH
jgi:hypothetical protein